MSKLFYLIMQINFKLYNSPRITFSMKIKFNIKIFDSAITVMFMITF